MEDARPRRAAQFACGELQMGDSERAAQQHAQPFESHARAMQMARSSPLAKKKAPLRELSLFFLAETVRFELTIQV